MIQKFLFLTIAAATFVQTSIAADASDMLVAENGQAIASIAVGEKCAEPVRFAAEELQRVVRKMAGAQLPIANATTDSTTPVIALGSPSENPAVERLLKQSGVDFTSLNLGADGFLLKGSAAGFIVAGETPRATLYGVYALLERLGCRWCFPGEHGEVVPQKTVVKLPAMHVAEKPAFSYRTFMHHEVVREETADWIDWMAKNRMNRFLTTLYPAKARKGQTYAEFKKTPGLLEAVQKRGLHIEVGHHASYYWIPPAEFHASHPEYFSLIKGKRGPDSFKGDAGQLCFSNPQVAEITADRIIRFSRNNPEVDILSLYANDGYGYCECEECKKLGSKTDAYIVYVNRVAERVYQAAPKLKLTFLSYSEVSAPPKQTKVFGKNTICVVATWPPPDTGRLKAWLAGGATELALYEYYMGSYSDRSLPGVWPKLIDKELKSIHKLNLAGVAGQCELDNWGAYGINYWVVARLLWNPTQNLEDVLADYFDHYYAEAVQPMQAYFNYLGSFGRMNCLKDVAREGAEDTSGSLGLSEDNLKKLDRLLSAGEKAAQSIPVQARIRRDRTALDYLRKAWTIEDARCRAKSFAAAGRQGDVAAELQRGAEACRECLDYMALHRNERVFLFGDPDNPKQLVGYHYNTQYYQRALQQFNDPSRWTAKTKKKTNLGFGPE